MPKLLMEKTQRVITYQLVTVNADYLSAVHVPGNVPKRFEASWLQEDTIDLIVQNTWSRASERGLGPTFMQKTVEVHAELHACDKRELKGPTRRIDQLKCELEVLKRGQCLMNHWQNKRKSS
jgi:hypothetical protein